MERVVRDSPRLWWFENILAGLSEVSEQICSLEMSSIGFVALKCCHWLHVAQGCVASV